MQANSLTPSELSLWIGFLPRSKQLRNSVGPAARTLQFDGLRDTKYNYALQDLFGVPWTFASDLPAEASGDDAFENNAESLHMSVKQIETYYQLALKALHRVTVRGRQPQQVHWSIPMKDAFQREKKRHDQTVKSIKEKFKDMPSKQAEQIERLNNQFQAPADKSHYLELSTGRRAEVDWNYRKATYAFEHSDTFTPIPDQGAHYAVVQPGDRQALFVELGDRLPDEGTMRVRIRASRAEGVNQLVPSLRLHFGFQATDQGRSIKRVSKQDLEIQATYGQPEIYQWDVPLSEIEHRNTYRGKRNLGDQPSPSEYIRFTNTTLDDSENAAILIDYVEVAAPVYDVWPPRSHRNLFMENSQIQDESEYAREIIVSFMSRAWRRNPTESDIDRKLKLFEKFRPNSSDFQEAIVEVLATILCSPKFLYVVPSEQRQQQNQDQLSQNELATRLSLFLWSSLPDQELIDLASAGRLRDHESLSKQVDRMLGDPRATRFTEHFVSQWLKMKPLEFLSPTRGENGLDEALLESMKREPIALFEDMLRRDSSILDFIESDYLVINERLAQHYGVHGVRGNRFRRVHLRTEKNRGGLLTQAGMLTINSDGKDSHPVKRGVWLLTNLLNDPPPPPPPAVPEIDLTDPEIAKMTLKERIEDHRDHAACLSCHQKIDPWGIAFENYDAMGRWRDKIDGKIIDAKSTLPDGTTLNAMKGLKEHLLQYRQEQFVRSTVEKMAAYSLGRQLHFGDRAALSDITKRVRESGDGVRTLVMCLATSELFTSK